MKLSKRIFTTRGGNGKGVINNMNKLNLIWEPNDHSVDPIVLSHHIEKINELIKDKEFVHCSSRNMTFYDVSNEIIIETLSRIGTLFALNETEYYYHYFYNFEHAFFGKLKFINRTKYTTVQFKMYSEFPNPEEPLIEFLKDEDSSPLSQNIKSDCNMLDIVWYSSNKNGTSTYEIQEPYTDTIHAEAYPYISNFNDYIDKYIKSEEQLLILIGPPGTGKSRLIRHILFRLVETYPTQKDKDILYTNDQNTLENDDIYIDFLTRECMALVAEDVDHHLKDRSGGSNAIHRILNAADGLIRGYNRKILLSTNLPNIKDIDPALTRPGRCFDVLNTRNLNYNESVVFLKKIANKDLSSLLRKDIQNSLASLYKILD